MKKILLFIAFSFLLISASAQQPVITWKKSYGGSKSDYISDVDISKDGKYYLATGVAHSIDGDIDTIHGSQPDFSVFKINRFGQIIWKKFIGGSYPDISTSINATSDGGCLVAGELESTDGDGANSGLHGNLYSDAWLVKLDSTGNIQWKKAYGSGGYEDISSSTLTLDKGYIFTGSSDGVGGDVTGPNPSGKAGIWVVKVDSAGNIKWDKFFSGSKDNLPSIIKTTIDGGYLIGGGTNSEDYDFIGKHGGNDNEDGFLIKLDKNGNKKWLKLYGGTYNDGISDVIEVNPDLYVSIGYSYSNDDDLLNGNNHGSSSDYWLNAVDSSGNVKWSKCYGGSKQDEGFSLTTDSYGDIIAIGEVQSIDGDVVGNPIEYYGNWMLRIDPQTGQLKDKYCFNGGQGLQGRSIVKDKNHDFLMGCFSFADDNIVNDNKGLIDFYLMNITWDYVTAINSIPMEQYGFRNAPNPFSSSTKISYSLSDDVQKASLKIYDLQGRLMRMQVLDIQASDVDVTAEGLADGVYIYTIETDGLQAFDKKRMVIIR